MKLKKSIYYRGPIPPIVLNAIELAIFPAGFQIMIKKIFVLQCQMIIVIVANVIGENMPT